jgi:hypothetical protein
MTLPVTVDEILVFYEFLSSSTTVTVDSWLYLKFFLVSFTRLMKFLVRWPIAVVAIERLFAIKLNSYYLSANFDPSLARLFYPLNFGWDPLKITVASSSFSISSTEFSSFEVIVRFMRT